MNEPDSGSPSKTRRIGRRSFLRYALGFSFLATLAGAITPIIAYLWPPSRSARTGRQRVLVGTLQELPTGQGNVLPVGDEPVIVVHPPQGLRAFSAVCTHLGCIVQWDQQRQFIHCPCHDGRFSPVTGAVISGPPPAPLPPAPLSQEGDNIYVGEV